MRFKIGDLVLMDKAKAHIHMNDGGFPPTILKCGIVLDVRVNSSYQTHGIEELKEKIIVKFPEGEAWEWLASDFKRVI
jgi:hypothetical protein